MSEQFEAWNEPKVVDQGDAQGIVTYTDNEFGEDYFYVAGDFGVKKYDTTGKELWRIDQKANDIAVYQKTHDEDNDEDNDENNVNQEGDIYITWEEGQFPNRNIWMGKYDKNGNEKWKKQFKKSSENQAPDWVESITVDQEGNFYLTGFTDGFLGTEGKDYLRAQDDAWVAKFDTNGKNLWSRQYSSIDVEKAQDVVVDATGNVYVTGYTRDWVGYKIFGYYTVPQYENHAWVIKYDKDGNEKWIENIGKGNNQNEFSTGIAVDSKNNIYVTGKTDAFNKIWLRKYNDDGKKQWEEVFGTLQLDRNYDITVDQLDNVYISGDTYGNLGGDYKGSLDAWVVGYNSNRTEILSYQFASEGDERAHGVAVDSKQNIYVTGSSDGKLFNNAIGGSAWVAKLNPIFGIDRWWATAGEDASINTTWTLLLTPNKLEEVKEKKDEEYAIKIRFDDLNTEQWKLGENATVNVKKWDSEKNAIVNIDGKQNIPFNKGQAELGNHLEAGIYQFEINGFSVPENPIAQEVTFELIEDDLLDPDPMVTLEAIFAADRREPKLSNKQKLIEDFAPILYFDGGTEGENGLPPNNFTTPYNVNTTWEKNKPRTITGDFNQSFSLSEYKDRNDSFYKDDSTAIYASISENEKNREIAINYYFHYPRSNWLHYGGFNTHQGDWEGITVFLDKNNETYKPKRVAFSQHVKSPKSTGGFTVHWDALDWDASDIDKKNPNVYVGLGGHATFPFKGVTRWKDPYFGEPNVEVHKGDLASDTNPTIIHIPHIDSKNWVDINSVLKDEDNVNDWLLYPGKWGIEEGPPGGPIFLDHHWEIFGNLIDNDLTEWVNNEGIGSRWLDPWKWSEEFQSLNDPNNPTDGKTHGSTYDLPYDDFGIIWLGGDGDDEMKKLSDEKASILRGGKGNDHYKVFVGKHKIYEIDNYDELINKNMPINMPENIDNHIFYSEGTFIEDISSSKGENDGDKLSLYISVYSFKTTISENVETKLSNVETKLADLNLKKPEKGKIGFDKDKKNGTNLIIDTNKDGVANIATLGKNGDRSLVKLHDVVIIDFFDENGNAGTGFIEEINNLKGTEIIEFFKNGTSTPNPTPNPEPTPEPIPEPTPEPTPEPIPEPTPEPIPEPTPEPTPEPSPAPSPTPTPTPTPGPNPTPSPTPTPTPGPNPTPSPVNKAPILNNQSFNIAENSDKETIIGTINATDPNNDQLTFTGLTQRHYI